jgi:predicted nucleotidyltransferase
MLTKLRSSDKITSLPELKNMIQQEIETKLAQVHEIFEKHKIETAFVFGSGLTDAFGDDSDIDILVNLIEGIDPVEGGEHLWQLEEELEELFGRQVELITERSLTNPYFIQEVEKKKIQIYG